MNISTLTRLGCVAPQPCCSGRLTPCSRRSVAAHSSKKGGTQKNEGVYFQYATEHKRESLRPSEDGQFSWVKEARQSHKKLQGDKERTSIANRPAPPGQRTHAGAKQAKNQQVRPATARGSNSEPAPVQVEAAVGAARGTQLVSSGSLAEDLRLLAGLGEEDDVEVGTFYDEDDPVDRQLHEIDSNERLSMKEKAVMKMKVLGLYTSAAGDDDDDDDSDGSDADGISGVRTHSITTTTGSIAADTPLQLMRKPARPAS